MRFYAVIPGKGWIGMTFPTRCEHEVDWVQFLELQSAKHSLVPNRRNCYCNSDPWLFLLDQNLSCFRIGWQMKDRLRPNRSWSRYGIIIMLYLGRGSRLDEKKTSMVSRWARYHIQIHCNPQEYWVPSIWEKDNHVSSILRGTKLEERWTPIKLTLISAQSIQSALTDLSLTKL